MDGNSENLAHAVMAVRSDYHHGVETLLALVFAGLQVPECVIGWMQEYATGDLRELAGSVGGEPTVGQPNARRLRLHKVDTKWLKKRLNG